MPYKRPYRKRPYRKRRVNRKTGKPTVASVNRKVMKIQRAIEYKHLDTFYSSTVGLTGTVFPISNALQGISDSQRVGDKLTTTSVMIKYMLTQYDVPYNTFRVVVLRARSGGAQPAIGNVFLQGSGPQAALPSLWMYNIDWFRSGKAKILMDKTIVLQGPNDAEPGHITRSMKIPFRTNVQFQGGSQGANNQLYVMIVSDSGTTPSPRVSVNVRINYLDL